MFITRLEYPDQELGYSDFECPQNEVITLSPIQFRSMRMAACFQMSRVFQRDPPDILGARRGLPIESETIEAAEDVAFVIIGPDCQVLPVSSVQLPES